MIKPYTLPSRSKSPQHKPKLVNKYVFANAPKEMKIVAHLKDKIIKNKKAKGIEMVPGKRFGEGKEGVMFTYSLVSCIINPNSTILNS